LLLSLLACASTPAQKGTGEYFDNSVITFQVKASIFNDPALKVTEIHVETFKGIVQRSGVTAVKNDMQNK
jgi:osmotically-inducible protein OsmY